jgi:hypothetical protein
MMLPLCFARLEFNVHGLEFKVCKGQRTIFELAVYMRKLSWNTSIFSKIPQIRKFDDDR